MKDLSAYRETTVSSLARELLTERLTDIVFEARERLRGEKRMLERVEHWLGSGRWQEVARQNPDWAQTEADWHAWARRLRAEIRVTQEYGRRHFEVLRIMVRELKDENKLAQVFTQP